MMQFIGRNIKKPRVIYLEKESDGILYVDFIQFECWTGDSEIINEYFKRISSIQFSHIAWNTTHQ